MQPMNMDMHDAPMAMTMPVMHPIGTKVIVNNKMGVVSRSCCFKLSKSCSTQVHFDDDTYMHFVGSACDRIVKQST